MKLCTMADSKALCLTVYNENFGLVSERRAVNLDGSEKRLQFVDVAQRMEVESLRVDGVDVAEVNYEYDLVDKKKLLGKYVGEKVFLKRKEDAQRLECRLLSAETGLILETADTGEVLVEPEGELVLPKLPEGLSPRPALVFQLRPQRAEEMGVSYLTKGLSWTANYVAELNKETLALDAWVDVRNESGITFTDARVKLLAGEVNRVRDQLNMLVCDSDTVDYSVKSSFAEKSLADYHLYQLQGTTTLKDNQSKQLRLFGAACVPYQRYYEVDAYSEDAKIVIELDNSAKAGLGMPFPAGVFKIYQRDESDGGLAFVGEDEIEHTPSDEKLKLFIGEAFDLRCERKCLSQRKNQGVRKEQWQITLKNHKAEPALMRVFQRALETEEITKSSHQWQQHDAWNVMFEVEVPEKSNEVIEFTIVEDTRTHVIVTKE